MSPILPGSADLDLGAAAVKAAGVDASGHTRVLSIHADYRCANTGVCCSSGWDIPVEPEIEHTLRAALDDGELPAPTRADGVDPFRPVSGLPHGARVVLRADDAGRCVFLDPERGRLCSIHSRLGPGALASACRDFPRIVTLIPAGISITLSHYCPTAAGHLFRDGSLRIEVDPPAFPQDWPYEGLDARDSVGPLLRPGVLLGWDALARWEEHAIEVFDRNDRDPEECLALLAAEAEACRAWTPRGGPFEAHLERCFASAEAAEVARLSVGECRQAWQAVAACVPEGHPLPGAPRADAPVRDHVPAVDWEHARDWRRPVSRWLAARAFASWLALQGEGLRTTVEGLRLSLAVLLAETSREGTAHAADTDDTRLFQAIRRADLLLVHLADPVALARRLSRGETALVRPPG